MTALGLDVAWIVPERSGGIRTYSDTLWSSLRASLSTRSKFLEADLRSRVGIKANVRELQALRPAIIHVQHEYGCFGSKVPFQNRFPLWVKEVRQALPQMKIVATAHTVIPEDYRYPLANRGWQVPFRAAANLALMPSLVEYWNRGTWGLLDGVIVHSALQRRWVEKSGCGHVRCIPHYVPECARLAGERNGKSVLVFGYFSPEKGQDIVIRAFEGVSSDIRLVLAGGVRRPEDQPYYDYCVGLIEKLGLRDRIRITGYVKESELDPLYQEASLVIAPFRETAGSGSLVQALGRAMPVLTSDLPLNREITERVSGCMEFFHSEDVNDLRLKMTSLLGDPARRGTFSEAAKKYADAFDLDETVRTHVAFYRSI
jgi:glycosyltransferase involved in cell wall biosynthesis